MAISRENRVVQGDGPSHFGVAVEAIGNQIGVFHDDPIPWRSLHLGVSHAPGGK